MGCQVDGVASGSAPDVGVLRMTPGAELTARGALVDAIRRVNNAPVIIASVFVITLFTALPFSLLLRESIRGSLGHSLAADEALHGVNYLWWTEYSAAQPA